MPDPDARSELAVLQAIRLAGVADLDAIGDRALLPDAKAHRAMAEAVAAGRVEPFAFGESSGWIITEAGSRRLAELLNGEVGRRGAAPVLAATLEAFEPLNAQFVGLVSRWQLHSTSSTTTGFGAAGASEVEDLLIALSAIGAEFRDTLADLIGVLPRFGRYPAQYAAAVRRARDDGLRWVSGVGLLSCHVVWAELHQDLLSSLGRDRHDDRHESGQEG